MTPNRPTIIVDPGIPARRFSCDLAACKGACCTLQGGRGAPLLEEEIGHLRDALPFVRPALSQEHLDVLDSVGPTEGPAGDRHTPCVDDRACVFVSYDAGVARCSIEQAFHRGEISWRKPLSCHLFPIRADGTPVSRMRFESIPECEPALVKGEREGVPLVEFLDEALERAVGDAWPALKEDMAP